jgi:hypothetical protein
VRRLVPVAAVGAFLLAAGTAQASVQIYDSGESGALIGEIQKADCKVKGKAGNRLFYARAKTTDGAYKLFVMILDFRGFGEQYNVPYGQIATTVDLEGTSSSADYSNAYPFPGGQPPGGAGAIAFSKGGKRMGLGVYALPNIDYSQGVSLAGGMKCAYPKRKKR